MHAASVAILMGGISLGASTHLTVAMIVGITGGPLAMIEMATRSFHAHDVQRFTLTCAPLCVDQETPMFRCDRCKNAGKIQKRYVEWPLLEPCTPAVEHLQPSEGIIKWREVECPDCLGFGAVGWALPG